MSDVLVRSELGSYLRSKAETKVKHTIKELTSEEKVTKNPCFFNLYGPEKRLNVVHCVPIFSSEENLISN